MKPLEEMIGIEASCSWRAINAKKKGNDHDRGNIFKLTREKITCMYTHSPSPFSFWVILRFRVRVRVIYPNPTSGACHKPY